jgi:hypothetical protein
VVHDQRYRTRGGEAGEVGDHTVLGRAGVVRHDGQRGVDLRPVRERRQRLDRRGGVVGSGADDQRRRAFQGHAGADVDDRTTLVGGQRGRLSGGTQGHDADGTRVEHGVRQAFQRVERDLAVVGERGDERYVDAVSHGVEPDGIRASGPVRVSRYMRKLN